MLTVLRVVVTQFVLLALSALSAFGSQAGKAQSVPVIYCTDLFHPHDDPDDHVDLAALFALAELDIRAIILDQGLRQNEKSGEIPVRQMMALTGRRVAFAAGLANPLRYPQDTGLNQFPSSQAGVDLILRVLKDADRKLIIITTGSLRDVMAAFNREAQLFKDKVDRIYVNAGNSAGGDLQWNPNLDPQAYVGLMRSSLPVYWCPSFGGTETIETLIAERLPVQQHQVYWRFRQGDVFGSLPDPLQNFFLYALGRKIPEVDEPISYLRRKPDTQLRGKQWNLMRNMWSVASLYHAAGREFCRSGNAWAVLPGPAEGCVVSPIFDFVPVEVTIDSDLRTIHQPSQFSGAVRLFRLLRMDQYEEAMRSSLRRLLSEMPLIQGFSKGKG